MSIHYIAKTSDYWLKVKLENGIIVSVPYGLKVDRIEAKNGREFFKFLEGVYIGKIGSVALQLGGSYLTTKVKHKPGAVIRFDRKSQSLQHHA